MLGEDAFFSRDPKKGLRRVDRRIGNAQLVGGEIFRREAKDAGQYQRDEPDPKEFAICHGIVDTAIRVRRSRVYSATTRRLLFLDTSKDGLLRRNTS